MTDPAVEAADRAWEAWLERAPVDLSAASAPVTLAAREALRPIREKWTELLMPYATRLVDPEATGAIRVLEAFAPLIFTTEELER
ncbi:hypothetical protein PROPHIT493_48 [Mycobacterium phage prophiT49-3]|nr:hypothetical protein PROPHIT493_48 [Mycobacterium phage prophiT49-3]